MSKLFSPESWRSFNNAALRGDLQMIKDLFAQDPALGLSSKPLAKAARNGHDMIVEFLIKQGASVDPEKIPSEDTPLIEAIKGGNWATVEMLLDAGADIDIEKWGAGKGGPLLTALSMRDGESLALKLLGRGARIYFSPREYDYDSWLTINPFLKAVTLNKIQIVDYCLVHRVNSFPDAPYMFRQALHASIKYGRPGLIKKFLALGANHPLIDQYPLLDAIARGELLRATRLLDSMTGDEIAEITYRYGQVVEKLVSVRFGVFAGSEFADFTIKLLDKIIPLIFSSQFTKNIPIQWAVYHRNLPVVKYCIAHDIIDPNFPTRTTLKRPLLSLAAKMGDLAIFKSILDSRNDFTEDHLRSALRTAAGMGHTQIVKKLIIKGADPNPKGKTPNDDRCALSSAVFYNLPQIADLLFKAGAATLCVSDRAISAAYHSGWSSMITMLADHGLDPARLDRYKDGIIL